MNPSREPQGILAEVRRVVAELLGPSRPLALPRRPSRSNSPCPPRPPGPAGATAQLTAARDAKASSDVGSSHWRQLRRWAYLTLPRRGGRSLPAGRPPNGLSRHRHAPSWGLLVRHPQRIQPVCNRRRSG